MFMHIILLELAFVLTFTNKKKGVLIKCKQKCEAYSHNTNRRITSGEKSF